IYTIGGCKGHRWYNRQLDTMRSKRDRCQKQSRRSIHLSQTYQRVLQRKRHNQRDCLHKASQLIAHRLVESTVVIGDLSQRQPVTNAHQQKKHRYRHRAVFNDGGLYGVVPLLESTCRHAGKELARREERYPSSQDGSRCGQRQTMSLWRRTYCCGTSDCGTSDCGTSDCGTSDCGLVLMLVDRDETRAINTFQQFLARLGPHVSQHTRGVLQARAALSTSHTF